MEEVPKELTILVIATFEKWNRKFSKAPGIEIDTIRPMIGKEKGNTSQGGTKPATLETGAVVNVPFFVAIGDVIRVDTRTNEYLDRC